MGYESLFTPFKIGNMEVKNRIGLSPMGTNSAFTNGRKDAQEIDYFIERAKGGTGILYMGCQMLNEQIAQGSMEGYLDTYTVLPSLTSVCDGCHRYGAKIVCQISPGTGRNAFPDTFGNPPISASMTSVCIQSRRNLPRTDKRRNRSDDGRIQICRRRCKRCRV